MTLPDFNTKELKTRELLIRVLYAPVQQLDREIMSIKPMEGLVSLERILGAEGSGVIEEVGAELAYQNLKGKKVAFAYGAWSQYVIKDIDDVIIF